MPVNRDDKPPVRLRMRMVTAEYEGDAIGASTVLGTLLAHAFAPTPEDGEDGEDAESEAGGG